MAYKDEKGRWAKAGKPVDLRAQRKDERGRFMKPDPAPEPYCKAAWPRLDDDTISSAQMDALRGIAPQDERDMGPLVHQFQPAPGWLRPRAPQPPPTPEDSYSAARTATYLGIAVLLIVIAVLVALHNP